MKQFKEAVLAGDFDAVERLLADDVRFVSPIAHKPYDGKPITAAILRGVWRVLAEFSYERELTDGQGSALVFRAKVAGLDVTGCDFIRLDDDGKIAELMVMVRPLKAAVALSEAMGAQFDQILADASAASAK